MSNVTFVYIVINFTIMESEIFSCINNDDVEGLKLLMDYPNIFEIEDFTGQTILETAIWDGRIAVFDFLLSLDGCPIARALQAANEICYYCYVDWGEHIVYSLLKKGADVNYSYENRSLLHSTLSYDYTEIAKLLIEKGADLNCQDDDGETPLHKVHIFSGDKNEMLAMMLYSGADPSIPDCDNYKPIDFALKNGVLSEEMQEHFLLYFFDDYCTEYEIPVESLFDLLESNSPLVPQVLKHITSVDFDNVPCYCSFETYFMKLFVIKPEYLKLLLEKFDYVIEDIIDGSLDDDLIDYNFRKEMFIENFDLLLQSQFRSGVTQVINKIKIDNLILGNARNSQSELLESVMVVLSYGANIYDFELERIYGIFGDCEFFRILLHMDIKISDDENRQCDIMPGLLYNVQIMDIEIFLSNPHKFKCSSKAFEKLLDYFAHPKLKSYCCSVSESKDICEKVNNLPSVPLLVELARNQVRKFLIKRYKIENSMQFYTLIKHLPISKVHQKIITLETKLY